MDKDEVEDLLIGLILEGKVEGKIDQVAMRLELNSKCVVFPLQSRSASQCSIPNEQAESREEEVRSTGEVDGCT